jgi:hypothetical protein
MVVFGFVIFGYLGYTVFFSASAGFAQSIAQQPEETRSLVFASFVLTFVSWYC